MLELTGIAQMKSRYISKFGFTDQKASLSRNVVATAAALILGVWFAFALQMVVVGLNYNAQRYGWDEIKEIVNQETTPEQARRNDFVVQIGSEAMKWGPVLCFILGPIGIFAICCYDTASALGAFLRLRWIFAIFFCTYAILGWLWSDFAYDRSESPLNLSSDGIGEHIWLFGALFAATFWTTHIRRWLERPQTHPPSETSDDQPTTAEAISYENLPSEKFPEGQHIPSSSAEVALIRSPIKAKDISPAVIAYLTFIPAFFLLFAEPYRRSIYVRFHAFQSILLSASWIGMWVVVGVVRTSGGDVETLETISTLVRIILFVAWLVAIINAGQGKWFKLPVIGNVAMQKA